MSIREILNEYRVRCIHGKKIGISEDQAHQAILAEFERMVPEKIKSKLDVDKIKIEILKHCYIGDDCEWHLNSHTTGREIAQSIIDFIAENDIKAELHIEGLAKKKTRN